MFFLCFALRLRSAAGQQGRSFFPARLYVWTMGKQSTIKILYFHRRRTNASGCYRLNYILQRGKKILYYATETRDFELLDCLTSSCRAEQIAIIINAAKYILKVHKVRYSCLTIAVGHEYANQYKARIKQTCTGNRFCKSDIIWTRCPRSVIPIKIPFSF